MHAEMKTRHTKASDAKGDADYGIAGFAVPPYTHYRQRVPEGNCPPGSVIRVRAPATVVQLRAAVRALSRRYPPISLVLTLDPAIDVDTAARLGGIGAQIGIPCIASQNNSPAALREALTRPELAPAAFEFWLRAIVPAVRDVQFFQLAGIALREAILRNDPTSVAAHESRRFKVEQLAALVGKNERQLRTHFRSQRLGSPSRMIQLFQLIASTIWLQRLNQMTLTSFAMHGGFPDSAALTHRFTNSVGATPTFIRKHLGWRWIAFRWLCQHDFVEVSRM
jgi:AraC-like DNA-binding protein